MKLANIRLTLSRGNDIPRFGVTPAEVAILVRRFAVRAEGPPVNDLEEVEEIPRTNAEEGLEIDGGILRIPLSNISKANLEIEV